MYAASRICRHNRKACSYGIRRTSDRTRVRIPFRVEVLQLQSFYLGSDLKHVGILRIVGRKIFLSKIPKIKKILGVLTTFLVFSDSRGLKPEKSEWIDKNSLNVGRRRRCILHQHGV